MTIRLFVIAGLTLAGAMIARAQEEFHHNFTVGGGAAIPVGSTTNFLSTAPMFDVGYGYRLKKWFQADVGLQFAFGAANNQNAEFSDFGPVQGGDHEFMIPLGARFIVPRLFKRIEFSAGGGAAYLHYAETIPSGGDVSVGCYSCTSRGGWGGYGLGNARYFLDENHNFSIGTTLQYISASTNGDAVGNVPSFRTTDHWVNVMFQFGLSF
jgi:outer membrane protein with beta-barrel domain